MHKLLFFCTPQGEKTRLQPTEQISISKCGTSVDASLGTFEDPRLVIPLAKFTRIFDLPIITCEFISHFTLTTFSILQQLKEVDVGFWQLQKSEKNK